MHGYEKILENTYFISDRDDYASPGLLGPRNFFIAQEQNQFFRIQNKIKNFFSDVFSKI